MVYIVLQQISIEKEIILDIFKNKIPYIPKYKLDLVIEPGSMINFDTWIPAADGHDNFTMPYSDMSVSVAYDDQTLINQQLSTDNIVISQYMIDDKDCHQLQIQLAGKGNQHTVMIKSTGQDAVAMIRIKLQIEELPINYALSDQLIYQVDSGEITAWSEFMGLNGQQTIAIETPIYPWLFKREQSILEEFSLQLTGYDLGQVSRFVR